VAAPRGYSTTDVSCEIYGDWVDDPDRLETTVTVLLP
jgi:hypothetical protein